MSDLKLFRISVGAAEELEGSSSRLEKDLQKIVERNMETMFGVRFLQSEYVTGSRHRGRIDSLGIDENYSPVIFEYKRTSSENVINQGLFYLDWLLDHRAEFELLVLRSPHRNLADSIDWRNPRLICVANDFSLYDEHAVQQIGRNIDLVRYRNFSGEFLALELVHSTKIEPGTAIDAPPAPGDSTSSSSRTVTDLMGQASAELTELYEAVAEYCESLGDDVSKKTLKNYIAFRRLKNFACVEVHPQSNNLLVYLKVHPDTVELEPGFIRDVRSIGHFGTGDLELRISTADHLDRALPLIHRSYEDN